MSRYIYFATFISGLQKPVKKLLLNKIANCNIQLLLDGAVVFETDCSYDRLNMYCFNNVFLLIDMFKSHNGKFAIEAHMQKVLASNLKSDIIAINTKKFKTFRVITSAENQLISVDNHIKGLFERYIAKQSKLILNRSKSDAEFWVLYRNEGYSFFLKRLSRHTSYEKILNKGELHPELAYLMNYIAKPDKTDLCLDPFCGYGAIPLARLKHFPTEKFFAFDNNDKVLATAKDKLKNHIDSRCVVENHDFNEIEHFVLEGTIDKIITDPPWGLFDNIDNIEKFYYMIVEKCLRLIKPDGKIVVLTAKKDELNKAVQSIDGCHISESYDLLVSGKKAGIFLIEKQGLNG